MFCQKWLIGLGIYLTVFGIVLAVFPQSVLMDRVFNNQIDPQFWQNGILPQNAQRFQAWIYGVLGATVAGWGVLLALIALYPFKARQRWAMIGFDLGVAEGFTGDDPAGCKVIIHRGPPIFYQ
jgi:hypothetical protein